MAPPRDVAKTKCRRGAQDGEEFALNFIMLFKGFITVMRLFKGIEPVVPPHGTTTVEVGLLPSFYCSHPKSSD